MTPIDVNNPLSATHLMHEPNHLFSIRRIDISYSQKIVVSFAPLPVQLPPTSQAPSEHRIAKIAPLFNPDRLHFTPAFMLEEDQLRLQRNSENLKLFHRMHLTKLSQSSQMPPQQQQILVARPNSSKYCHVCKGAYEDYLTHTSLPCHHSNIEKNKFWNDIRKLCAKFEPVVSVGKSVKSRQIRKKNAVCKRNTGKHVQLVNSDTLTSVQTKA